MTRYHIGFVDNGTVDHVVSASSMHGKGSHRGTRRSLCGRWVTYGREFLPETPNVCAICRRSYNEWVRHEQVMKDLRKAGVIP